MIFITIVALIVFIVCFVFIPIAFRKVVETNKVAIVQTRKKTISYGTGQEAGNIFYRWPSWIPIIGITSKELPVSNFDLPLHGYKAYDKERVPFELDVVSFFRIADTNVAAARISNVDELKQQLLAIVQGAVRKILASHDINQIMVDRATFGQQFTDEVKHELTNWGVEPVKNMELMDIRDADGSKVIANIMAKKSSFIAMESRMEVAKNNQAAETAEIAAKQAVNIRQQESEQAIGERTADKEKMVGIAQQKSQQEVKTQEAVTKEKEMAVLKVAQVKQAEITKEAVLVTADQQKQTTIIAAEGQLEATKRHAEGVTLDGNARGAAEQALLMANVQPQITLAKEIGANPAYQSYLVALKAVEAYIAVGTEQAKALVAADVKVIANTGNAVVGVDNVMQLFTPKGGLAVGGMLEALGNTPEGQALLSAINKRLAPVQSNNAPSPCKNIGGEDPTGK